MSLCRSVPMPGCVHVVPQGELDVATIPQLDHSLRIAGESDIDIVLDLRELGFIDSSGAHLLIAGDRRIRRAGGRLRIIQPQHSFRTSRRTGRHDRF